MPKGVRSTEVSVNREIEPEEPRWAEGGSYMAFLLIV